MKQHMFINISQSNGETACTYQAVGIHLHFPTLQSREMSTTKKASPGSLAWATANNHFALQLHRQLAAEKMNVFFSPFSISSAMTMLLCAAEGETEREMGKVLGLECAGIAKKDVASTIQRLISDFVKIEGSYTLTSANSVLTQKNLKLKEEYKSVLRDSFKALLLEVDFQKDTENIVCQINDWVKKETKNKITELVEKLDSSPVMMLLNAVYFKGSWMRKFDEKLTAPLEFFNNGDIRKVKYVEMMNMKEKFLFAKHDSFKALQLPYVGKKIAMLVLLPNDNDGLEALEASLTPSFVEDLSKTMRKRKLDVTLPRFRLGYFKSLVPFFMQMGIEKLFGPEADLGGAIDSVGLFVSDIIHKAALEVNEEGTEAAAATMVEVDRCEPRRDITFTVNHPFALVIYDIKSNLILFMGRVEEL